MPRVVAVPGDAGWGPAWLRQELRQPRGLGWGQCEAAGLSPAWGCGCRRRGQGQVAAVGGRWWPLRDRARVGGGPPHCLALGSAGCAGACRSRWCLLPPVRPSPAACAARVSLLCRHAVPRLLVSWWRVPWWERCRQLSRPSGFTTAAGRVLGCAVWIPPEPAAVWHICVEGGGAAQPAACERGASPVSGRASARAQVEEHEVPLCVPTLLVPLPWPLSPAPSVMPSPLVPVPTCWLQRGEL